MKESSESNNKNQLRDCDRLAVYADIEESIVAIIGYDSGQFFWRSVAITLIIGNLAVIGFLLGAEAQELPFSAILACIWTCVIFLTFNFCIIWTDLFKEEKLSLSCLFNILDKEKENKWLFPIFENSKDEEGRRHGALEKKIQFYIECGNNLILIATAAIIYIIGFENFYSFLLMSLAFISSSILIFFHSYFLKKIFIRVENFAEKFLD